MYNSWLHTTKHKYVHLYLYWNRITMELVLFSLDRSKAVSLFDSSASWGTCVILVFIYCLFVCFFLIYHSFGASGRLLCDCCISWVCSLVFLDAKETYKCICNEFVFVLESHQDKVRLFWMSVAPGLPVFTVKPYYIFWTYVLAALGLPIVKQCHSI